MSNNHSPGKSASPTNGLNSSTSVRTGSATPGRFGSTSNMIQNDGMDNQPVSFGMPRTGSSSAFLSISDNDLEEAEINYADIAQSVLCTLKTGFNKLRRGSQIGFQYGKGFVNSILKKLNTTRQPANINDIINILTNDNFIIKYKAAKSIHNILEAKKAGKEVYRSVRTFNNKGIETSNIELSNGDIQVLKDYEKTGEQTAFLLTHLLVACAIRLDLQTDTTSKNSVLTKIKPDVINATLNNANLNILKLYGYFRLAQLIHGTYKRNAFNLLRGVKVVNSKNSTSSSPFTSNMVHNSINTASVSSQESIGTTASGLYAVQQTDTSKQILIVEDSILRDIDNIVNTILVVIDNDQNPARQYAERHGIQSVTGRGEIDFNVATFINAEGLTGTDMEIMNTMKENITANASKIISLEDITGSQPQQQIQLGQQVVEQIFRLTPTTTTNSSTNSSTTSSSTSSTTSNMVENKGANSLGGISMQMAVNKNSNITEDDYELYSNLYSSSAPKKVKNDIIRAAKEAQRQRIQKRGRESNANNTTTTNTTTTNTTTTNIPTTNTTTTSIQTKNINKYSSTKKGRKGSKSRQTTNQLQGTTQNTENKEQNDSMNLGGGARRRKTRKHKSKQRKYTTRKHKRANKKSKTRKH